MKLPTEVDVVGLIYQAQEVGIVNRTTPRNGEVDFQKQIITIDKGLSDDRKKIVLLHEIIHVETEAFRLGGICDGENTVQSLTVALYHTFERLDLTFS